MPLSAVLTSLIPDANPMGTDFIGGAEPLTAEATEEHAA